MDHWGSVPYEAHLTTDYFDIAGWALKDEEHEESVDRYMADWRPECVRESNEQG